MGDVLEPIRVTVLLPNKDFTVLKVSFFLQKHNDINRQMFVSAVSIDLQQLKINRKQTLLHRLSPHPLLMIHEVHTWRRFQSFHSSHPALNKSLTLAFPLASLQQREPQVVCWPQSEINVGRHSVPPQLPPTVHREAYPLSEIPF
jgi:hypothetical protein